MLASLFFKFLFQILKENKDKKDAEFNERFKHSESSPTLAVLIIAYNFALTSLFNLFILNWIATGPPKALDEEETEFLDKLEMVSHLSV